MFSFIPASTEPGGRCGDLILYSDFISFSLAAADFVRRKLLAILLPFVDGVAVFPEQSHGFLISLFIVKLYPEDGFLEFTVMDDADIFKKATASEKVYSS